MLTLDPLHPLQSAILETLAREPGIGVAALHERVTSGMKVEASLPNLYRVLGQLTEEQVVVKDKGKLWLHSVWIRHMTSFLETIQRTHSPAHVLEPALKPGERREFRADSLLSLDPTWFQICLEISRLHPGEPFYMYNAHTWYALGMPEQDQRGYTSLTGHGTPCYFVCGNDTFLDRHGMKLLALQHEHIRLTADPPFPHEGYNINVCGDHVIECAFPDAVTRHFKLHFENVGSADAFDAELFADVFRMKARCRLTVRRDAAEAERVRSLIARCF